MAAMQTASRLFSSASSAGSRRTGRFLPFDAAKEYIKNCGTKFSGSQDYRRWSLAGFRPSCLPSHPDVYYASRGWRGFPDFLGYEARPLSPTTLRKKREAEYLITNPGRESMRRRGAALASFLEKLQAHIPEYEGMRLTTRWPSIVLLRRAHEAGGIGATAARDEWIVVQVKFGSSSAKSRQKYSGRHVFANVIRDEDVGVIFLSEDGNRMGVKRSSDVHTHFQTGIAASSFKNIQVTMELDVFHPPLLRSTLDGWWSASQRASFEEWTARFSGKCSQRKGHDDVIAQVCKQLYLPLSVTVEKQFPMDASVHGNIILSGIRCLQRVSRPHAAHRGYFFDLNTSWASVRLRKAEDSDAEKISRYICIFVDRAAGVETKRIRGLFILPREYVVRGKNKTEKLTYRRTLLVYPPFVTPCNARSQARQDEQRKYYVDCEEMTREEQLSKTRELLGICA